MGMFDFLRSKPEQLPDIEIPTVSTVVRSRIQSPEATYDNAKEQTGVKRMFPAGEWDDLTADWSTTPTTSFGVIHSNLSNLRARARVEYRKNDYARRFVNMMQTGVVGPNGFQLQGQFKNPDGELDETANRAFETHWRRWGRSKANVDVKRLQNFTAMCRQLVSQLAIDGEVFVRWFPRGPMGFQLQILDPVIVDVTYNDIYAPTGNKIRFGIELDEFGGPVAYHLNKMNDLSYFTGERVRVPAGQIYHVYLQEMVDQYRGIPWIATPSYRMHMLDGFEEASLVNARAGASKMGFRKALEPERFTGEGEAGEQSKRELEFYAPGGVDELGMNEDWVTHDPTYPQGEFKDYVKQVLRGVASGLLVSYPTLANDLEGVNYTSLRHDSLQERDVFMGIQTWLAEHLLQEIYNDWLLTQMGSAGGVPIPRKGGGSRRASPGRMDKYRDIHFQGRRWQWVDPLKEVQAHQTAIELGITTRAQVIRDTGRDPEEVLRDVEIEQQRFGLPERPGPGESDGDDSAEDASSPQGD